MPRPLWSGSLGFGLVNVPVNLYSAVRDRGVHFHQLHEPDRSPIETQRVCAEENRAVPWEEIARGYELESGRWVLLSDADLEAAAPRKSKTIDIERFVQQEEIDPLYYEHAYLLAPRDEEGAIRAYALLSETMRRSGQVAVGRFVLRARELLVGIRSREGALTLSTMRFHDEIRPTKELDDEADANTPNRTQVDYAVSVIEELEVEFEPERYRDEHRANLRRIIESKQKGRKITPAPETPETPVTANADLTSALEQSLAVVRQEAAVGVD
jgi:DNA end-binding protein Ku